MKTGITELVLLIGKSCSEAYIRGCTEGFESLFSRKKLNVLEGEVVVTTILFDDTCHIVHDRVDIHALQPLVKDDLTGSGDSAWTSAINTAIDKSDSVLRHTNEQFRPDKVLYVMITDGIASADEEQCTKLKEKIASSKDNGSGFLLCVYDMNNFSACLSFARKIGLDYENIIRTFRKDNEKSFFIGLLGDISRYISNKTSDFICMYSTDWWQKLYTIRTDMAVKGVTE